MVACVPFSSISRQRNARAIALTMALSMWRLTGAVVIDLGPAHLGGEIRGSRGLGAARSW